MAAQYIADSARKYSFRGLNLIYFLLCFSVSLAGLWVANYRLITVDNAAILTVARQMLDGRHLYSDLFTSQFPLIFYLSMPPLWLHALLGIPTPEAFFFCVFLLLQLCVLLSWHIARWGRLCSTIGQSYTLLLLFYFVLFILPIDTNFSNFGQREHLFCGLILPYVILAVNRLQGVSSTRRVQVAAGILAALGFCIKPHFCILFILSECFQMVALRRFFSWNRDDAWTIAALCGIYYLLFFIFHSQYLALIPRFVTDYSGNVLPLSVIMGYAQRIAIPPILFTLYMRRRTNLVLMLFMLTLIGGGEILYVFPRLPFFYHAIPVYFFSFLLFVLSMLAAGRTFGALVIIAVLLLYIPIENAPPDTYAIQMQRQETLKDAALLAHYKTIASFNSEAGIQPALAYTDVKWVMCAPYLEYIPAAYRQWRQTHSEPHYHAPQEMDENERYFHEKVIRDLQQMPDAIIVDESPTKSFLFGFKFDYLHYFLQDPRFQEIWSHYELVTRISRPYETSTHSINSDAALYRRKD